MVAADHFTSSFFRLVLHCMGSPQNLLQNSGFSRMALPKMLWRERLCLPAQAGSRARRWGSTPGEVEEVSGDGVKATRL